MGVAVAVVVGVAVGVAVAVVVVVGVGVAVVVAVVVVVGGNQRRCEMNPHVIEEVEPHAVRSAIISALFCATTFFFIGFFGRDIWNHHAGNAANGLAMCAPEATAGTPKRTLQWRLPDEPKK